MAIRPEEFANQYLPITFKTCVGDPDTKAIKDGVVEMVHIKTYINARLRPKDKDTNKYVDYEEGKGMPDYEVKDMFRSFIIKRSKDKTSGITKIAAKYEVTGITPTISYKDVSFPGAFMGKFLAGGSFKENCRKARADPNFCFARCRAMCKGALPHRSLLAAIPCGIPAAGQTGPASVWRS